MTIKGGRQIKDRPAVWEVGVGGKQAGEGQLGHKKKKKKKAITKILGVIRKKEG